jgi:Holliday junction resolvasome RuvABC DNA-binding subunit
MIIEILISFLLLAALIFMIQYGSGTRQTNKDKIQSSVSLLTIPLTESKPVPRTLLNDDAIKALEYLRYSKRDAKLRVEKASGNSVEEIVKNALQVTV